jgi:hypothetical protein
MLWKLGFLPLRPYFAFDMLIRPFCSIVSQLLDFNVAGQQIK